MKVKKIKRILEEALLDLTSDVDGADCLLFPKPEAEKD